MEYSIKSKEDLVQLYQEARTSTIKELLDKKANHKRVMALEKMWLQEQIEQGVGCGRCNEKDDFQLSVDHIIPESLLEQFGLWPKEVFMPMNYEVLCKRCNWFKSSRLDFANPKTKILLKKFVEAL